MFWVRLGLSITAFTLFVLLGFPLIGRWFFKRVHDNISQYIFVLAMVFLGAFLAQLAGLEAIIGSFLAGLALNRLIPATSPLMNRVEFVGNAIFIPFFLLSVGMLIDYRAFFTSFETIKVGAVMIVVATAAKFIAAWLTQKTFRMSVDQRRVIFGLSNAQAAATLAAVLVGYNVILGTTPDGEPIRLLNESVLNGTILMILVTCTMASFSAQKGAHNIAMEESTDVEEPDRNEVEILIPVSNQANVEELVNLGLSLKPKRAKNGLHALTVVDDKGSDGTSAKRSKRLLQLAVETAAATDTRLQELLRYDLSPGMRHYRRHPGTARTQGYFVGIPGARGGGNHCRQHDQRIHLQAGAAVVDRQASSGSPAAAGRKGGGVPQCAGTSGQRGREHWCQGGVLRRTRHARSDSGTLRAVVERNRLRPVRELGGFLDRFARRAYRRYAVDLDEPPQRSLLRIVDGARFPLSGSVFQRQ